jgi:hypothetical protein
VTISAQCSSEQVRASQGVAVLAKVADSPRTACSAFFVNHSFFD